MEDLFDYLKQGKQKTNPFEVVSYDKRHLKKYQMQKPIKEAVLVSYEEKTQRSTKRKSHTKTRHSENMIKLA